MRRSLFASAISGLVVSAASAALLPVVNPSFELVSRPLAVGEQSNGMAGAGVLLGTRFPFVGGGTIVSWDDPVEVPGWRTAVLPFGSPSVIRRGVLNPPMVSGVPFIAGQDGQYVAAAQAGFFQQTLNHQLQPNTRYRLDFLAGIGRFDSEYFAGVALLAAPDLETLAYSGAPAVIELVRTQAALLPSGTAGTLLPFSIAYTTPTVLPPELAGRYVAISCFGSDGIPRVVYDHFRLDATIATPVTCRGDVDCDGVRTFKDIDPFVARLGCPGSSPAACDAPADCAWAQADMNADGEVDFKDISGFVAQFGVTCP